MAERRGVVLDYGMTGGKLVVSVRYALLYYFYKRLRFDVGAPLDGLHERPVVIANRELFEEALVKAKAQSGTSRGNSGERQLP